MGVFIQNSPCFAAVAFFLELKHDPAVFFAEIFPPEFILISEFFRNVGFAIVRIHNYFSNELSEFFRREYSLRTFFGSEHVGRDVIALAAQILRQLG